MAIMRVEKNNNYTVMANHHLRDKRLSLKAKGLLSVMISLPPEWDFTLTGLACISREGTSIFRHDPEGKVAQAYHALTKEVLTLEDQRQKHRTGLAR